MNSTPVPPRPLAERAAVAIVAVAVVAGPLALGCSSAAARFGLETSCIAAVLLWLCCKPSRPRLFWAPVFTFAALLVQNAPLPDRLLVNLAPVSAGAWKIANETSPSAWGCISINPACSFASACRVLLLAAVLASVIDLGRYRSHRFVLFAALATSASLIVGLGLCFGSARQSRVLLGIYDLSGPVTKTENPLLLTEQTNGLGWPEEQTVENRRFVVENRGIGDGFGCYRYSNHFAGGTVLTLPIAVALWLWASQKHLSLTRRSAMAGVMLGIGLFVVGGMAQSRAGTAALVFSAMIFLSIAFTAPWARLAMGWVAAVYAGVIVAGLAVMLGAWHWLLPMLTADWQKRIDFLLSDGRALAAQIAVRMFRASPWLGTGLTSFEQIFPRFHSGHTRLYFAHNDYAQILAETGLVGALILGVVVIVVGMRFRRFLAGATGGYRLLNAGPWAALAGIVVHSAFDWNMYLPANAFLCAVVLALCISSVPSASPPGSLSPYRRWMAVTGRWLLLAIVVGAYAVVSRDLVSEISRKNLGEAMIADRLETRSPPRPEVVERLADAIAAAESVAAVDPRNASLAVALSQAHLRLAARQTDPEPKQRSLRESVAWGARARSLNATCRGIPEEGGNR